VSRSGDKQFRDGDFFCGRGSLNQRSIGNEIVLGFLTNGAVPTNYECTVTSIIPSKLNCDCGWNVRSRIVGGTSAGINEFVSHAGLVDQPSRDVFCGATIGNSLKCD
jgi:hypothetical protein